MMSGAEADISSDGETSFEDEDVPLPKSPLKEGTDEPFQVILKGGDPWGFSLKGSTELRSSVQIAELEGGGKAAESGLLKVEDYVLQVNNIACNCLPEAEELIQSAFRTLTLQMWRGTTEAVTSPTRSASFLQKARELSERARQAAQDDSALFAETKRMKPRQRRIESFHGSRRGSTQSSSSSVTTSVASPISTQQTTPTSSTDGTTAKPPLKGWATEHDLSSHKPVIKSSGHVTVPSSRHMPLSPAKSTPSLSQEEAMSHTAMPRGYKPNPPPKLSMTKSTPDIPDQTNNERITSPTSPKSPSWYQKLPNRSTVFDFSAPNARRSPRNSYAGGSPRNSYASGSPRNSYASSSPRNSFSGYGSHYPPQSPVTGFSPASLPTSGIFSTETDINFQQSSGNYSQSQKLIGANFNSYDDSPSYPQTKNYDRRSLPPQALYQLRHDYQKDQAGNEQKHLTSMPVTREEEEIEKEISSVKRRPPNELDIQSTYTPPAPPVRDISSLKYVSYHQNHEKYPSWPVTTGNPPQNLGPPVDAHTSMAVRDKGLEIEKDREEKAKAAVARSSDRSNASSESRSSEENNKSRNQSDPGFNKKQKATFYTTRKPNYEAVKEPDYENMKSEEERFNDFCRKSQPGYPPPKLDPDGHNYGDEKYSIPSPPERDMPNLDEKSLVQKIAEVIHPGSSQGSFQFQYHASGDTGTPRTSKTDSATSPQVPRIPGIYFQQAMNAQNLLRSNLSNVSQSKNMVDSGTSPINSPSEEKAKFSLRTVTPNPKNDSFLSPTDKSRGLIIRQMPYYNTSTQTDDLGNQSRSDRNSSSEVGDHSEQHSHSSGFSSMTFSDQSSAPMLRKLSEEFYRGKLSGNVPNEKRLSSASAYDEMKSPRSESHYGSLKEAESYTSVVIHPNESAGLFGKDDLGSNPSLVSSKPETSDTEHDHTTDQRLFHKSRYSMDSSTILQKTAAGMGMPPRSLNESRFTSENNLSSASFTVKSSNYSQSLLHLNRPSSSLGDPHQYRSYQHSSESSASSRPRSSLEARSSGSRLSSGSSVSMSALKSPESRNNSDSVFVYDSSTTLQSEIGAPQSGQDTRSHSVSIGRKESMKMAYGTYDENEHHYATPYGHQRNNSEVLSTSSHDPAIIHSRSASYTSADYLPMHYNLAAESQRLGQIKEEGSEVRWQEAVRKSRSLSRDGQTNYENVHMENQSQTNQHSSEIEKKEIKTGMRRTVSEQIRPKKSEKKAQKVAENKELRKDYSSSGESSKENKSDNESVHKSMSQHLSDSNLKQMQQKAVLDFVERKSKGSRSSDSSETQSPKPVVTMGEDLSDAHAVTPDNGEEGPSPQPGAPHSPIPDISKRYHYTKAQRNESLKRTRSISSNSSRDSADYMEMKRLQPNFQTEWSRLRSQDGVLPRRPLSIGSDITGGESFMATSSPVPTPEEHSKSLEETDVKQVIDSGDSKESTETTDSPPPANSDAMVTSPIYQNYGGDYPRRPPPPVPGISGDQPPAVPPRNYPRFINSSKSESFLLSHLDNKQKDDLQETYKKEPGKWENGTLREDAYAQQLRRQARRFSEQQHKPISMQVVSTKTTMQVNLSQSYKQEPAPILEAMPMQKLTSSPTPAHQYKHSPTSRTGLSPEPPPLPTPLKNGETEIKEDLNKTADFPPPPAEFTEDTPNPDRCADDSYGSYKSRAHREVGKYNRAKSDTNVLHISNEVRTFRHDQTPREGAETPNKPPRRKLELQVQGSPVGRSSSPSMPAHENPATGPVPAFSSAEVSTVQHAPKSMAQPLQSLSVQKLNTPPPSGGIVSTVVQKPGTEDVPLSVRDRIKSIEVFSHSPGSGSKSVKNETNIESAVQQGNTGSLEQLESSIKSSNSFRERLRPVVRKVEQELSDAQSTKSVPHVSDKVSSNVTQQLDSPPQVPSRSYRQMGNSSGERPPRPLSKPSDGADSVFRKTNLQNQSPDLAHPRPYENKSGAHIHSPVGANTYNKSSSPKESQRSPGQSVHPVHRSPSQSMPEPQVPSRQQVQRKHRNDEQTNKERNNYNENVTSPEVKVTSHLADNNNVRSRDPHLADNNNVRSRDPHLADNNNVRSRDPHLADNNNVRSRDHIQTDSVHLAQKRNYNSSFPSSKSQSEQGSSQVHYRNSSHSPKNRSNDSTSESIHHQQNRSQGNTQKYSDNTGSNLHKRDIKGSSSSEPKQSFESEQKSPAQTTSYQHGDFRHRKSEMSPPQHQPTYSPKSMSTDSADAPQTSPAHAKDNSENTSKSLVSVNHGRQPSAEELDCDKKAQELAKVLKDSDRELSQVLTTDSNKIRMQYLDGILQVDPNPDQRRPRSSSTKEDRVDRAERAKEKEEKDSEEPTSPMPSNYYVSPPKAMIELEIRKFGDTSQLTQDIEDNDTLAQKKEELLQRMIKKLDVLKDDKRELLVDIEENELLGQQVLSVVETKCRSQQEKDKYRGYIEDMDKIIRLLLKLSGLLARAENTIQGLNENTNEKIKKMTYDKRDRLHQQHEDAKELKVDIDRRSDQIEVFLRESLLATELDDYHYYIKMKSKYTIQMQELEDKITLGNEQILALQKSIPVKSKS